MKFLSLVFVFSATFAFSYTPNWKCEEVRQPYLEHCGASESACQNLAKCQERREACPQDYNSADSCEELNRCMNSLVDNSDKYKEQKICKYKWEYFFVSQKEVCRLNLSKNSTETNSCPGVHPWDKGIASKKLDDRGFDCSAQKDDYQNKVVLCAKAYKKYREAYDNGVCEEGPQNKPKSCEAAQL